MKLIDDEILMIRARFLKYILISWVKYADFGNITLKHKWRVNQINFLRYEVLQVNRNMNLIGNVSGSSIMKRPHYLTSKLPLIRNFEFILKIEFFNIHFSHNG